MAGHGALLPCPVFFWKLQLWEDLNMESNRLRTGWSAIGLVGLVFFPIGLIFLVIGLAIGFSYYHISEIKQIFSDMFFLPVIFAGMGLLFTVLGGIFLLVEIRRKRGMRRAFEGGYAVKGVIAGYRQLMNVSINGRHPYVIECHVHNTDTGILDVYQSRYVPYIPDQDLIGREVDIYIDRMDGKSYYVDIDKVMPRVVMH